MKVYSLAESIEINTVVQKSVSNFFSMSAKSIFVSPYGFLMVAFIFH
jgi:hypothetical protein